MKRVHQYDGPTTEPSPPVQGQTARKPTSRKRKASTEEAGEKRAKVVKLTAEQQRQQRREALTKEFLSKKQHIIEVLTNLSTPSDLGDDIQLTKEVVGLHDICTQYRDVFGG
jgi:phosphoenolpyruvate-protein kinase (PTS system EI component)